MPTALFAILMLAFLATALVILGPVGFCMIMGGTILLEELGRISSSRD